MINRLTPVINWRLSNLVNKKELMKLSYNTGISFNILKNIYENNLLEFDLDMLARLCYSLGCNISDLLEIDF